MNTCGVCGCEVHPLRIKFLEKYNKPITCINHSNVEKVGGFMTSTGKTERELIITSQETANQLYKMAARAGTGVSRGVKMNQSFKANIK
jgi:hypothetical protein